MSLTTGGVVLIDSADNDHASNNSLELWSNTTDVEELRGMKMSNFFHPAMLIPQLIVWGLAPILLANLKMFVMQVLMLNKMALNAAIYMTLRTIVFGPRPGPLVKYVNHGYSHPHRPHPHRKHR